MTNDRQRHTGDPVRIGLVGLGGHGGTIQQACAAAGNLTVAAVFDVAEAEARAAAARFGCDAAPSYDALLARGDLEAVVLVTPNALHRAQTEAALAAGLHVLVEKPIANTVADGLAMVEAAEAAGHLLMVGHNLRRGAAARQARRLLDEGALGEVVSVEIHFSADNTRRLPRQAWRLQPDECPLLPVMQLGIHAIDLVHYLIGPIQSVYAVARSVTTTPGVIDNVTATFGTEPGVQGTMISNYCTQALFDYRISGTEATLHNTRHRSWLRRAADVDPYDDGPAATHDYTPRHLDSFVLQMRAFGEAVRTGAPLETDGRGGLQALAVVEAIQCSAETGTPQQVPSFEKQAHNPGEL